MKTNSVSVALCFLLLLLAPDFTSPTTAQSSLIKRVNVRIVTDEADAVLQILAKRESGEQITEADWQKVFSSEGYVRLKHPSLGAGYVIKRIHLEELRQRIRAIAG